MKSPDTFYEVAIQRLDAQWDQIEAIDSKIATFLGFGSAILAIFIAALQFFEVVQWPLCALVLLSVAMAIYIALLVFVLLAYRFSHWSFRPDLKTFRQYCLNYDEGIMKQWVADECILSIEANEPQIASKTSAAQKNCMATRHRNCTFSSNSPIPTLRRVNDLGYSPFMISRSGPGGGGSGGVAVS